MDDLIDELIAEINDLHFEEMPKLEKLNALVGRYVNLEYRLPSGVNVKFLDDTTTYLGNQLEPEFGGDRCFGVLANMDFILVCTYEKEDSNPELVLYKKGRFQLMGQQRRSNRSPLLLFYFFDTMPAY